MCWMFVPIKQRFSIKLMYCLKILSVVLFFGIDGAHAPTRLEPSPRKGKRGKGEWKEVKGFRMYLINNDKIIHLIR